MRRGPRPTGPDNEGDYGMVVGICPEMIETLKTVGAVSNALATVLVRGESGTGKELLARAVHRASGRTGAFVAINCVAVVESLTESELFGHERGAFRGATDRREGCFEQANGGTLFLDEIEDASPSFQAKFLRELDRGEFIRVGGQQVICPDVRLVAATNANLEDLVSEGRFRPDLYYRINEVTMNLPALRERREDIQLLANRLLVAVNRKNKRNILELSNDAMERLVSYH